MLEEILKNLPVGTPVCRIYLKEWGTKVGDSKDGLFVQMKCMPCKGAPDGVYVDETQYEFLSCEALLLAEKL